MLYATVRQRKIYVKNPTSVVQNGVGVDQLTLDMDDEWKEMTSIVCVFTLKHKAEVEEEVDGETVTKQEEQEVTKEMIHQFGEPVLVPWECLTHTGTLSVSCTGYVEDEKVMTTMLPDSFWTVVQNGAMEGDAPAEATPTLYEQVLAAAGAARTAASNANAARSQLLEDKENGVFDGVSPTVEVGSVATGAAGTAAQVENVGTAQAVKLNFVIPRGAPGTQGRGIASIHYNNDGWYVVYTDGTRQVVNGPSGGLKYPYVVETGIVNGKLLVTSALSAVQIQTEFFDLPTGSGGDAPTKLSQLEDDAEHRTVTDLQIEEWDNKSDFSGSWDDLKDMPILPYQFTSNGMDGMLLMRYLNGAIEGIQILPALEGVPVGAFLRVDADGYLAWQALTDVSKEEA